VFSTQSITDFDDPRLAPFRNMRAQWDHLDGGVFVAEGEKVVRRLLESPLRIRSILLPPKWKETYHLLLATRPEPIDLFVAEKQILEELIGFSMYQGLLGLAQVPLESSLEDCRNQTSPRLIVALDGLTNAENVGAIVRNAVAFGVQTLIVGETCAHPYLRRAVRSSMGTIFKLPYIASRSLPETLHLLRKQQVRCIAAHPHVSRRTLWDCDWRQDTCIVLGAEGDGVRKEVLVECDEAVMIPMASEVDSLNVGAAAAVFLSEVSRQRAM